jgi:metallo-beta-lactamase class B
LPSLHPLLRTAAFAAALATALAAPLASAPALAATATEATEATVKAHVDAATRAAGEDLKAFLRLCQPAPAARASVSDDSLAKLIATPGPEPQAAFDNLFYLGSGWVSAWALKTSDGIVLIDALNTVEEVDRLLAGGMKKLGLDPAQIKAVLVTHGHGDHYGGVERVKALAGATKPRVVMSELDWTMTRTQLEFASPLWPAPPRFDAARDVAARDGDVLRQGDAEVLLPLTPGHTLGTISPIIEVKSGGRSWRAVVWGGTSFNFGRDLARLDAYIRSTERMQQLVRQHRVEVLLSNHPSFDSTVAKLAELRQPRAADAPHPYVVGTETVLRALTVAGECARANKVRFEAQL